MKEGTSFNMVREKDVHPAKSQNTRIVAAALASGIRPATDKFYSDTIEDKGGGVSERQVTWLLDAKKTASFEPDFERETINFSEFNRRMRSQEWCEANPSHPIAYLREYIELHNRLVDRIKQMRPMIMLRKGQRVAIVPSGNSPEETREREEILAEF